MLKFRRNGDPEEFSGRRATKRANEEEAKEARRLSLTMTEAGILAWSETEAKKEAAEKKRRRGRR